MAGPVSVEVPFMEPTPSAPEEQPAKVLGMSEKWTAIGLVVFYLVCVGVLFAFRGDTHWDRLVYLLSGLEAIVFAAVGALYGTSVQRGQADEARKDAYVQTVAAVTARNQATVQRALAARAEQEALAAAGVASAARALAEAVEKFAGEFKGWTSVGDPAGIVERVDGRLDWLRELARDVPR